MPPHHNLAWFRRRIKQGGALSNFEASELLDLATPVGGLNVTLRFRTAAAKAEFLGQLSDGIGEPWVALDFHGVTEPAAVSMVDVLVVYEHGGLGVQRVE